MEFDDYICFAIYAASHSFNRVYKKLLYELGLTYPQYLVMVALWSRGNLMVSQLGEMVDLESNTLTPMLKRLEAIGLVTRTRSSADERQVHVSLTDAGLSLRERARHIPQCISSATGLAPQELRRLTREIKALGARLEAHSDTSKFVQPRPT